MISKTLRTIDPEHDDEEFLEAVGDAYCMVNYLLSTGDLETLRPMMTDQLHRSFCEVGSTPWQPASHRTQHLRLRRGYEY
jgi:hypothetical protein